MKRISEILDKFRHIMPGQAQLKTRFYPSLIPAQMLVIDRSGSMSLDDYPPTRFEAAKTAANRFVEKAASQNPHALVGAVFFADEALVAARLVPAQSGLIELQRAIAKAEIDGSTNTSAGLEAAASQFEQAGSEFSPQVVLLTDGFTTDGLNPVQTSKTLKEVGIQIDIIGIGGSPAEVNEPQLKQMASVVNGQLRYWFIRDTVTLIKQFEALALREF